MVTMIALDPNMGKIVYTNDRVWISLDNNHLENFKKKLNENNYKIIETGNVSSQLFFVVF
jgi:hypothetical protein